MKEIEVKAKVKGGFDQIKTKLLALGCTLSEPIIQEDKIFLPKDLHFANIPTGTCVLRIRKQKNKTLLTLKKSQKNELVCIEKETTIGDSKIMKEVLLLLGYNEEVNVNKSRIKCNYRSYEICLDRVDDLGDFIEIEKITDEPEENVLKELASLLTSLGVDPNDKIEFGYDTLLSQKSARAKLVSDK